MAALSSIEPPSLYVLDDETAASKAASLKSVIPTYFRESLSRSSCASDSAFLVSTLALAVGFRS